MEYERHGGSCCGISHVFGFDYATEDALDEIIRDHDVGAEHGSPGSRTLEAVLSERQVNPNLGRNRAMIMPSVWARGGWAPILFEKGFRLVGRFNNSNSDQNCYIFHRNLQWMDHQNNLPFEVQAAVTPVVPPTAPAPVIVKTLYGVRPAGGGVVRYFDSEADLIDGGWTRAINKFRLDIYSDGTQQETRIANR